MTKSMARLGLTSFLDGFAMGGLFTRARWFGAPVLGFAPSSSKLPSSEDAELDRLIEELLACLDSMKREDEVRASSASEQLAEVQAGMFRDCGSEKVTSRAKRLHTYVSMLETYLREKEASDGSLKSAAQSSGS